MNIVNDLKPYNKFLVALAGAILNVVVLFYGNNPYVSAALSLLTAVGVHLTPNKVG